MLHAIIDIDTDIDIGFQ